MARKPEKLEPRKCAYELCDVIFVPQRKNKKYHSGKCQKAAENRRSRGPSVSERMVTAKGRRCSKCRSAAEGKRTAVWWNADDRAAENVQTALVLCSRCTKRVNAQKRGHEALMKKWDRRADEQLYEIEGLSIRYADQMSAMDDRLRRNIRCEECGSYSCEIAPNTGKITFGARYKGNRDEDKPIEAHAFDCPRCLGLDKRAAVDRPVPAQERYRTSLSLHWVRRGNFMIVNGSSRVNPPERPPVVYRYEWSAVVDDDGVTIAAVCVDIEEAAAA